MLKPYCVKRSKTEEDMVSKHISTHIHTHHLTDLGVCTGPPVFYWRHWYLVVHDCSQAHDANMHVVFLAHESGVLDGSAAGN